MQTRNRRGRRTTGLVAALSLAMAAVLARAGNTCTWNGSWGAFPSNADDVVVISSGGNLTWSNTMPATVGSWTQQAGYTNTVTFQTVYGASGFTNFTVTGDMTVSGGTLTHINNSSAETYKLNLTVNGNMTIGTNGAISAVGLGYVQTYGPGKGTDGSYNPNGSYGGLGGGVARRSATTFTSGSITSPTNCGSGGTSAVTAAAAPSSSWYVAPCRCRD